MRAAILAGEELPTGRPMTTEITRELLSAYLDDALAEPETARIEQELRQSESLRARLKAVLQDRDRGDHTLGAVWRREHLSCPTREQLGSHLLQALDPDYQAYLDFHLKVVGCPACQANLEDLKSRHQEPAQRQQRRKRYFDSSAGYLTATKKGSKK